MLIFLSAIQATTQLVEEAFRIIARLKRARKDAKELPDVLGRLESELHSVKAIIGMIDHEEDLHR